MFAWTFENIPLAPGVLVGVITKERWYYFVLSQFLRRAFWPRCVNCAEEFNNDTSARSSSPFRRSSNSLS